MRSQKEDAKNKKSKFNQRTIASQSERSIQMIDEEDSIIKEESISFDSNRAFINGPKKDKYLAQSDTNVLQNITKNIQNVAQTANKGNIKTVNTDCSSNTNTIGTNNLLLTHGRQQNERINPQEQRPTGLNNRNFFGNFSNDSDRQSNTNHFPINSGLYNRNQQVNGGHNAYRALINVFQSSNPFNTNNSLYANQNNNNINMLSNNQTNMFSNFNQSRINHLDRQLEQKPPNIPPINNYSGYSQNNSQLVQRPIFSSINSRFNIGQLNLQQQNGNLFARNASSIIRKEESIQATNMQSRRSRYQFIAQNQQQRHIQQAQNLLNRSLRDRYEPRAVHTQLRQDQDVTSVSDSESQDIPVQVPQRNYGSLYRFNSTMNFYAALNRNIHQNMLNNQRQRWRRTQSFNNLNAGEGLTQKQISKLPKSINTHAQELTCAICQDEIVRNKDSVTFLFCFHSYHSNCIEQWLKLHITCPGCKDDVRERIKEANLCREETSKELKWNCPKNIRK